MNRIKKENSTVSIHLELLLVMTIWASAFVSTKIVLKEITPAVSALYRDIIASGILIVINYRNPERIARKDYPLLLFLSATGVTLYFLLQHYGMKYTNATDAAILISLTPVFIGVISWILLGEKLKTKAIIGLGLAFFGSFLVIVNGTNLGKQMDQQMFGNFLILLSALSWTLYSVYGKKMLKNYSAQTIITYTTVIGTLLLIPFALPELISAKSYSISWLCTANLFYLGGAASVYGYLAWYRALEKLPAVIVGSYQYFRPLLTGVFAAVLLNEKISLFVIAGGFLIIAGTYITTKK